MQADEFLFRSTSIESELVAMIYLEKVIKIQKLPRLVKWFMGAKALTVYINKSYLPWKFTALHQAVRKNRLQMVKMLLKAGADVSLLDIWGRTPLHYACCTEVVILLRENGALLNHKDSYDRTLLHRVMYECDNVFACFLLEIGADFTDVQINIQDEQGETLLCYAVALDKVDVARSLLQNGAHLEVYNSLWMTPIHIAVKRGHFAMIELLMSHGGNINQLGFGGTTPLFFAIMAGHRELSTTLIQIYDADALIRVSASTNATLLHSAAHTCQPWAVRLLVEHGVDVNAVDLFGKTSLDYAIDHDHVDFVDELLVYGAKLWSKNADGEVQQCVDILGWRQNVNTTSMTLIKLVYKRIEEESNNLRLKKEAFTFIELEPGVIDMILQSAILDSSPENISVIDIMKSLNLEVVAHDEEHASIAKP
jgi:ankyrin repeat protein